MKTTILIISIVVSLVIGGGVGYSFGKGMNSNSILPQTKELQDSIAMMKEQSASIKKMAEMMKSSGLALQEMGMKYKDDEMVVKGKDLEAVGEKYIEENTRATEKDTSMKKSMN